MIHDSLPLPPQGDPIWTDLACIELELKELRQGDSLQPVFVTNKKSMEDPIITLLQNNSLQVVPLNSAEALKARSSPVSYIWFIGERELSETCQAGDIFSAGGKISLATRASKMVMNSEVLAAAKHSPGVSVFLVAEFSDSKREHSKDSMSLCFQNIRDTLEIALGPDTLIHDPFSLSSKLMKTSQMSGPDSQDKLWRTYFDLFGEVAAQPKWEKASRAILSVSGWEVFLLNLKLWELRSYQQPQ